MSRARGSFRLAPHQPSGAVSELLLPAPHRPWNSGSIAGHPQPPGPWRCRLHCGHTMAALPHRPHPLPVHSRWVLSPASGSFLAQNADAGARHLDIWTRSKRFWEGWSLHASTQVMHSQPSASSGPRAGLSFQNGVPPTCFCQLRIECQVFRTEDSFPNVFKVFGEETAPHPLAVPCWQRFFFAECIQVGLAKLENGIICENREICPGVSVWESSISSGYFASVPFWFAKVGKKKKQFFLKEQIPQLN